MKIKQHSSEVQIAANHTPYRSFKAKVLNELLFTDKSQYAIADEFKINQSMISKWLKKKDDLFQKAAASKTKHLLKYCPARKSLPMYETLLTTFREARKKRHHVDFNWFWSRVRIIYREQLENPSATVKKRVMESFLKCFDMRMRCRQRNKKQPKEYYHQDLQKWPRLTRERLIRTGFNFPSVSSPICD